MKTNETDLNKTIRTDITGSGEKHTLFALIKFGQEQFLRDLLNTGSLYFSSKQKLRGSKKENSDNFRYDSLEGATLYESHRFGIVLNVKNSTTKEDMNIPARRLVFSANPKIVYANIVSFYGITDKSFVDNKMIPVDSKMKDFGSHFILIYDFQHFMRRIDTAFNRVKLNHSFGKVEYFDEENHIGELHYYHKRSGLSYQNEYRIHIDRESTSPYLLKIENLREFAVICHSDTLEHLDLTLNPDDNSLNIKYLRPSRRQRYSS